MDVAIVLYPRFTALDAIGPYEVLRNLPGTTVTLVAESPGEVRNDVGGLGLVADAALHELPSPDVVVVPGGPGQADQMAPGVLHEWLRAAHATSTFTTSVCTGSLILASAGILDGLAATCHWLYLDQLRDFGVTPTSERVVEQGRIVTAAGVSSGIDMALRLAAHIAGDEIAQAIQLGIEYDPQPPFDAGSPDKAPADIVDFLRSNARAVMG
ncbi:DJ-1/PfpI family protein [Actinospongicola halichondriae]|uniref:DJ-1/PfpI family protein n=1 Tax=Actinospongicola halichondriae TaxID=3236844 RepID=UPI003D3C4AF0